MILYFNKIKQTLEKQTKYSIENKYKEKKNDTSRT